ncbi:hypothetical protein [Gorillibacterium sp. sgz500922]|uniref:hypothetical protein n=1 Tax=Gorillibacterium sp. sgz500922 TaxID=3446694 RepID=UPI003F675F92
MSEENKERPYSGASFERGENGQPEPAMNSLAVSHPEEEAYLRRIYVKASLLEYDRLEDERVRRNAAMLRKRMLLRLAVGAGTLLIGVFLLKGGGDRLAGLLAFSLAAIGLGLIVEQAELEGDQ